MRKLFSPIFFPPPNFARSANVCFCLVRGSLVRTDITTCLATIVYRAADDPLVVRLFLKHPRRLSVAPYRLFDNLSSMTSIRFYARFYDQTIFATSVYPRNARLRFPVSETQLSLRSRFYNYYKYFYNAEKLVSSARTSCNY